MSMQQVGLIHISPNNHPISLVEAINFELERLKGGNRERDREAYPTY